MTSYLKFIEVLGCMSVSGDSIERHEDYGVLIVAEPQEVSLESNMGGKTEMNQT